MLSRTRSRIASVGGTKRMSGTTSGRSAATRRRSASTPASVASGSARIRRDWISRQGRAARAQARATPSRPAGVASAASSECRSKAIQENPAPAAASI
ncbi:hypothetical protein [Nocardioides humi]|uniref:hypothetical protein n=1 Tax=Nocardioides humi TaxID=449461 RepID=UPI00112EF8D0|nr:hypothetical protein [Nocardioides humi]